MADRIADLRRARAQTMTNLTNLKREYVGLVRREAEMPEGEQLPQADKSRLDEIAAAIQDHERDLQDHEERIQRAENALQFEQEGASDVGEAERGIRHPRAEARIRKKDHETDPSLVIGGIARMLVAGGGTVMGARTAAMETLGDRHPVTEVLHGQRGFGGGVRRELMAGVGPSGGFLVPPDYVAELIELLRPMTVVRASNPRMIEMPRGTMQMPRQTQAATASYSGETQAIPVSQQSVGQIVASYKKLTALTPVTNDLIRYSDPAVDALVRDDLAKIIARREDLAFIRGDGTSDSPRGFKSFALPSQTIASTAAYTLTTAAQELGGALNKIESANVPMSDLVWIMHPRSKNYLLNVQNSNGWYVYREEMTLTKTLLGWPFKTSTQIPTNLTVGANSDCSEIYLVSMEQAMLFDSMRLELSVSREGTYTDASGSLVSVFQQDQTLIRGIAEHDFHMRHDEAIALISGVRWAPAIS